MTDLPPLTPEEVERMIAAIPARPAVLTFHNHVMSLDIDQLMAERLDLADLEPVEDREFLLAWIDRRIAELDGSA